MNVIHYHICPVWSTPYGGPRGSPHPPPPTSMVPQTSPPPHPSLLPPFMCSLYPPPQLSPHPSSHAYCIRFVSSSVLQSVYWVRFSTMYFLLKQVTTSLAINIDQIDNFILKREPHSSYYFPSSSCYQVISWRGSTKSCKS